MNFKKIIFEFTDSSVPPPYHRSYTITVDKKHLHIIVDSYGDIVNEQVFPNNKKNFKNLLEIIKEANLRDLEKKESEGCTWGTTQAIKLFSDKEEEDFSWHIYFCGGDEFGTMAWDIKSISKFIRSLIPDFSSVIE